MLNDVKELEKILGSPLPEIDPIYKEGAKLWSEGDIHPMITEYFLSRLYDPEEMRMVMCLPGTAKEVAEKMGKPEGYVYTKLKGLLKSGKVMPGKKYHLELADTFVRIPDRITMNDYTSFPYIRDRKDMSSNYEYFQLLDLWLAGWTDEVDPEKDVSRITAGGSRIIPKWESIKNIPGIMHCENMREIFDEEFANGTMGWMKCVCRSRNNLRTTGKSIIEGTACETGLTEYDQKDGHCLWFGELRSKYMHDMFDLHMAEDKEDLDRCFNEIEEAKVIYTCTNKRSIGNCCTCCGDCCTLFRNFKTTGYNHYIESRFKPTVSEDKCVGCKICSSMCLFEAISYDANGKCVIDETKCKGCGNCVVKCPTKTLKMRLIHDTDWIPEIF